MKVDLTPILRFRYNQISNYHFQYVMLDKNFRALHTPFQCKDYVADIFWCENRNQSSEVYGMMWEPGTLDMSSDWFMVALLGGKEVLKDRVEPLAEFLNTFEKAQGFPLSKVYETEDEKIIVVEFHKDWTTSGPLLSALTTLMRVSGTYSGGDVMEYLMSIRGGSQPIKDYMKVERNRIDQYIRKLAALLQGQKVEADWLEFDDIYVAHDMGIIAYNNFPKVEV